MQDTQINLIRNPKIFNYKSIGMGLTKTSDLSVLFQNVSR